MQNSVVAWMQIVTVSVASLQPAVLNLLVIAA